MTHFRDTPIANASPKALRRQVSVTESQGPRTWAVLRRLGSLEYDVKSPHRAEGY
jgi:hypothetical protein